MNLKDLPHNQIGYISPTEIQPKMTPGENSEVIFTISRYAVYKPIPIAPFLYQVRACDNPTGRVYKAFNNNCPCYPIQEIVEYDSPWIENIIPILVGLIILILIGVYSWMR